MAGVHFSPFQFIISANPNSGGFKSHTQIKEKNIASKLLGRYYPPPCSEQTCFPTTLVISKPIAVGFILFAVLYQEADGCASRIQNSSVSARGGWGESITRSIVSGNNCILWFKSMSLFFFFAAPTGNYQSCEHYLHIT